MLETAKERERERERERKRERERERENNRRKGRSRGKLHIEMRKRLGLTFQVLSLIRARALKVYGHTQILSFGSPWDRRFNLSGLQIPWRKAVSTYLLRK